MSEDVSGGGGKRFDFPPPIYVRLYVGTLPDAIISADLFLLPNNTRRLGGGRRR